jgi:SHS2 domain-containing protein
VTGRYEILEHTADVGIQAEGQSLEEVYAAAGEGVAHLLDAWFPGEGEPREVYVEGDDRGALLVAWLDELLYLNEVLGLVFGGIDVLSVDERELRATVRAGPAGDREVEGVAIKAATFHRLDVSPLPDGSWRATVYLDV